MTVVVVVSLITATTVLVYGPETDTNVSIANVDFTVDSPYTAIIAPLADTDTQVDSIEWVTTEEADRTVAEDNAAIFLETLRKAGVATDDTELVVRMVDPDKDSAVFDDPNIPVTDATRNFVVLKSSRL